MILPPPPVPAGQVKFRFVFLPRSMAFVPVIEFVTAVTELKAQYEHVAALDRVKTTAIPGPFEINVVSAVCDGVPPVKFRFPVTVKPCPLFIKK